jgi:uncharacterized protein (TIGR03435 family)
MLRYRFMKILMWFIVALAMLSASVVAQAPNLVGNWQGTLQAGKELRIIFAIANADGGGLRATMYSIDQSGQGIPVNSVTLQGSTLRMSITGIGGNFEGTVSGDGQSIAGNWSQGAGSLSLTLRRSTPDTAWTIPALPKPMDPNAPAVFEVATIKPSIPDRPGKVFTVKGRQVVTINTTTNDLITFSYDLHARQIVGGPPWMESEKYDVTGQPEGQGQPSRVQLSAMMKKLLEDRFKFTFHREKRELPVYAITVQPGGHKLTRNDNNPNGLPGLFFKGLGTLPAQNATMGDFAGVLQGAVLDRPVIDRTGLQGRWDFTLRWTPDESQFAGMGVRVPPPSNDPDAPPGIFTAFQEQLGLKLESTRGPVDVLVVDTIEKPSEN